MATQRELREAFIRTLKSPLRRAYAERYLAWVERGEPDTEGEPSHYGLSDMAARAVRLRLHAAPRNLTADTMRDMAAPPRWPEATP